MFLMAYTQCSVKGSSSKAELLSDSEFAILGVNESRRVSTGYHDACTGDSGGPIWGEAYKVAK